MSYKCKTTDKLLHIRFIRQYLFNKNEVKKKKYKINIIEEHTQLIVIEKKLLRVDLERAMNHLVNNLDLSQRKTFKTPAKLPMSGSANLPQGQAVQQNPKTRRLKKNGSFERVARRKTLLS